MKEEDEKKFFIRSAITAVGIVIFFLVILPSVEGLIS